MKNGEKFHGFVVGLDPNLQSKIHEMGAGNLDDAALIAGCCERARAALHLTSAGSPYTVPSEQAAMVRPDPVNDRLLQAVEQLTLTVTNLKHEVQHLQEKHS